MDQSTENRTFSTAQWQMTNEIGPRRSRGKNKPICLTMRTPGLNADDFDDLRVTAEGLVGIIDVYRREKVRTDWHIKFNPGLAEDTAQELLKKLLNKALAQASASLPHSPSTSNPEGVVVYADNSRR